MNVGISNLIIDYIEIHKKEIEDDMFAWHHRAPNEDEYKRFTREINES